MCDAYYLGRAAFIRGEHEDSNPFPSTREKATTNIHRRHWFDGYFDARSNRLLEKLGHSLPIVPAVEAAEPFVVS